MRRMKILYHVTPEAESLPIYHEMVAQLALCMRGQADVDEFISQDAHSAQTVNDYDLVHVFGSWNMGASHLMMKAYHGHVPTVYSPLGGLQPWVIKRKKSVFTLSSQRNMTRKALAVHVCGKLEQETFLSLKWHKCVALIKNPVLTSKISFPEMASQMFSLYQKVIDTYACLLLSDKSCKAIGALLALGIDDTLLKDTHRMEDMRALLTDLNSSDWRKISIYASDERITGALLLGLERLQVPVPLCDVDDIERFPHERHYVQGSLQEAKLLSRNPLTKSKLNEIMSPSESKEKSIIVRLFNMKYEMEHNQAPLSHLADVYRSIRFCDADEDRLKDVARSMGILDFSQRLMAVLQATMGLTEGFMPFKANDDKMAKTMTKDITKFNSY